MQGDFNYAQVVPGAAPGIEHDEIASFPGGTGQVSISCIDYSPDQVSIQAIDNLEDFVGRHRPEWAIVRLFIVTHALQIQEGRIQHEQVSIFLGQKTIMTFQEHRSREWDPIRQRIKAKGSRLRNSDASFLAYLANA